MRDRSVFQGRVRADRGDLCLEVAAAFAGRPASDAGLALLELLASLGTPERPTFSDPPFGAGLFASHLCCILLAPTWGSFSEKRAFRRENLRDVPSSWSYISLGLTCRAARGAGSRALFAVLRSIGSGSAAGSSSRRDQESRLRSRRAEKCFQGVWCV